MSVMKDQIQKRAEEIGKESAYPIMGEEVPNVRMAFGLTKLELFAAMDMQVMLANRERRYTTCAADAVKHAQSLCVALAAAELEGGQNG